MRLQESMNNFLKKLLNRRNLLLLAIFIAAALVRFYNFPDRVTFWSEQARSLVVSANYIKDKPSLLGQEYFRTNSFGHTLFAGATFNYSLVPLLLIFNYNPIPITVFFALLNLFTAFVVYWVVGKIWGQKPAIFTTFLFVFSDVMIYHSLFIWILNNLPLIGALVIYFIWLFGKKQAGTSVFWLGVLSGLGISLEYMFIPIAGAIFVFVILKSRNKLRDLLIFSFAAVLGNLPMVLFDIRHNFYHMASLWQYALDTLRGTTGAKFTYYYLLPLWPAFCIIGGFILAKIYKFNKLSALVLTTIYLYLNLTSPRVSFGSATGMPEGLTTKDISNASQVIATDAKSNFNVAEVLDFDKRAYVLRYFVEFKYGKKPLGEEEYQNLNLLYVLAPIDYDFKHSNIWEINAGGLKNYSLLTYTGNGYAIYKLTK
jgi:hypothetical protein